MNLSAVPVVYYHSVKYKARNSWVHPHITLPLEKFEKHLKLLKFFRTKTYFMDDIYFHLKGDKKLPINSIALTFDDGYLDNYTFVFPLLKKYKMKATFWVNPDFVDNEDTSIRPTLEDYWNNKISIEKLNEIDGFINWEEMRLMEKSGLVDIQSHTMTHNQYPISNKIIDFVNPATKIDWLYWNLFPNDKSNFLSNPQNKIPLGYPIYESGNGNTAIKCEENGILTNKIIDYVENNGGINYFQIKNWKENLVALSDEIKKENNVEYKIETEKEFEDRIDYELVEAKKRIEKYLDKKVNHLCWPFGARNEFVKELAKKNGYKSQTVKSGPNVFCKKQFNYVDRIALDNPKYQNFLFYFYGASKILKYKI